MATRSPSKTRAVPSKTDSSKPADFTTAPSGREAEIDQATRPVDRVGQGADDLAVDVRRVDVGEVLGERPARDREAVPVEQTGVEQGPHDDRDSADAVDVES